MRYLQTEVLNYKKWRNILSRNQLSTKQHTEKNIIKGVWEINMKTKYPIETKLYFMISQLFFFLLFVSFVFLSFVFSFSLLCVFICIFLFSSVLIFQKQHVSSGRMKTKRRSFFAVHFFFDYIIVLWPVCVYWFRLLKLNAKDNLAAFFYPDIQLVGIDLCGCWRRNITSFTSNFNLLHRIQFLWLPLCIRIECVKTENRATNEHLVNTINFGRINLSTNCFNLFEL